MEENDKIIKNEENKMLINMNLKCFGPCQHQVKFHIFPLPK